MGSAGCAAYEKYFDMHKQGSNVNRRAKSREVGVLAILIYRSKGMLELSPDLRKYAHKLINLGNVGQASHSYGGSWI